jgi:hypothetical protein
LAIFAQNAQNFFDREKGWPLFNSKKWPGTRKMLSSLFGVLTPSFGGKFGVFLKKMAFLKKIGFLKKSAFFQNQQYVGMLNKMPIFFAIYIYLKS